MKCEDFVGKVVESVTYPYPDKILTIYFTDGTHLIASDTYDFGIEVTTSYMDLEPS